MKTKKNRIFGLLTVFIIFIFLSGNIINIPKGTYERAIINAIGVIIIITTMTLIANICRLFITNKK